MNAVLHYFRQWLRSQHFTEIVTSKLVASGTEGDTNLFEVKYFERSVYLAQSPQFYKEYGVAGLERLTTKVLLLANVRQATLYPRDRYRVSP